ncbi:hypothetical protein NECAME_04271 [Necator americanus]|uniref:Uncharacterized protein n=1 Tax=Necator americanus TaxID=51031 RepID=W2SVB8_NECAM|nr:hypothetical protein NECAME_04271 [Necator americanus]ETN73585.1 hypothetical protein NECAME_04271 [Necator americanus]
MARCSAKAKCEDPLKDHLFSSTAPTKGMRNGTGTNCKKKAGREKIKLDSPYHLVDLSDTETSPEDDDVIRHVG